MNYVLILLLYFSFIMDQESRSVFSVESDKQCSLKNSLTGWHRYLAQLQIIISEYS